MAKVTSPATTSKQWLEAIEGRALSRLKLRDVTIVEFVVPWDQLAIAYPIAPQFGRF